MGLSLDWFCFVSALIGQESAWHVIFNLTAKEGTDFFYIQLKSTLYLSLCVVFNRFSDNAKKNLLLSIMREPLHRSMRLTLFIGVVLDKNLIWKSHISSIAEKTS